MYKTFNRQIISINGYSWAFVFKQKPLRGTRIDMKIMTTECADKSDFDDVDVVAWCKGKMKP